MGFGACAMEADDTQRGIGQRQCRSANLQRRDLKFPSLSQEIALRLSSRGG